MANEHSKETGKNGISAKIIADSISEHGKRITSFELEYPRMIHSEVMTHRLFSRNAASSRAIPIKKKLKMVWSDPAMPVHWGKNQPGMQAKQELTGFKRKLAKRLWRGVAKGACVAAWTLYKCGVHKQIVNRVVEPFERYKVVLTSTEFNNWFWLRDHEDAQPEIAELAKCMSNAMCHSTPIKLNPGEWHLPYIDIKISEYGKPAKYFVKNEEVDLETAKMISASCCAQISYRVLNLDIDKAKNIFYKLIESVPVHASPTEHQATPMKGHDSLAYALSQWEFEDGITHMKFEKDLSDIDLWSGNFCGWIQYRQLITNNVKM